MSLRQLPRKHLQLHHHLLSPRSRLSTPRRFQSSSPTPPSSTSPTSKTQARANKVLDKVPRSLRRYTDGLRNAPVSHIVSFLILHEITAIVPLFGLASLFHWTGWVPGFIDSEVLNAGIKKWGGYLRKKGYFGLNEEEGELPVVVAQKDGKEGKGVEIDGPGLEKESEIGVSMGSRIVVEIAAAYAVTKVLLPARLLFSVWLTPWFAKVVFGRFGRLFGRG